MSCFGKFVDDYHCSDCKIKSSCRRETTRRRRLAKKKEMLDTLRKKKINQFYFLGKTRLRILMFLINQNFISTSRIHKTMPKGTISFKKLKNILFELKSHEYIEMKTKGTGKFWRINHLK